MLVNLHVKNMAVIQDEEIHFGAGMNVLTGETGAGKSLLLGSVNLVLGARADKSVIRQGAEYALVEMTFKTDRKDILDKLKEEDLYPDDGTFTLARKITEGRSNARINGETVSASTLSYAAGLLLDIYGQQDSQILLKRKKHLELLDDYGGKAQKERKEIVRQERARYRELSRELEESGMDEDARKRRLKLIRYEIEEIETAGIKKGEDDELEELYQKLLHGRGIIENAGKALELLSGDGGAFDQLDQGLGYLSSVAGYDAGLEQIQSALLDCESLLSDRGRDLERYIENLDFSEELFAETEERLNLINRLKDKYGSGPGDIAAALTDREAEEEKLCNYAEYREKLSAEKEESRKSLCKEAEKLTALRKASAAELEEKTTENLKDLNFPSVSFKISLAPKVEPDSDGAEDIEFLISMNPGEPLKPLSQIASGGELSRIMLAIRTVMSDKDAIPTLIFDEIDAGISGRTAQRVAEKLRLIAASRQVICITHLAQIAAMADHHFVIDKSTDGITTNTTVREVSGEESVEELSRILGGSKITEAVRMNAREMKKLAKTIIN